MASLYHPFPRILIDRSTRPSSAAQRAAVEIALHQLRDTPIQAHTVGRQAVRRRSGSCQRRADFRRGAGCAVEGSEAGGVILLSPTGAKFDQAKAANSPRSSGRLLCRHYVRLRTGANLAREEICIGVSSSPMARSPRSWSSIGGALCQRRRATRRARSPNLSARIVPP